MLGNTRSSGAIQGQPRAEWTDIGNPAPSRDTGVWPVELQRNEYFRRRGSFEPGGDAAAGDFDRLKELVTEYRIPGPGIYPVRNALIRAYQYLIGKFDLDGYRIDTLQYVEPDCARVFGNAMREYALSIGKKNFLTFGEVWQDDDEARIAEFIGRNTTRPGFIGVDASGLSRAQASGGGVQGILRRPSSPGAAVRQEVLRRS
jgi:hypothetical protein